MVIWMYICMYKPVNFVCEKRLITCFCEFDSSYCGVAGVMKLQHLLNHARFSL